MSKGTKNVDEGHTVRDSEYQAKECYLYLILDPRTLLKEFEQKRDWLLEGISKERYLGTFLGIVFLIIKSKKNNIYCTRMVLNEITYIMCWLVRGSLPILFPESDLIISTCSSLRPQGQQLQQHRDINKARCYKGSWRPTSRDLADKEKACNKKRKGGKVFAKGC